MLEIEFRYIAIAGISAFVVLDIMRLWFSVARDAREDNFGSLRTYGYWLLLAVTVYLLIRAVMHD